MSQIVKTTGGFGIEVPVCAGICSAPSNSTTKLKKGQIVVGTTGRTSTNGNVPLFVSTEDQTGTSKSLKDLQPINKVLPLDGNKVYIGRKPGGTYSGETSMVGGFAVDNHSLDGDETDVSVQKIKNFTAENVKVILESGSYGAELPSEGAKGQIFFLYGNNATNSLNPESDE